MNWDYLFLSLMGGIPFAGILALVLFGGRGEMFEFVTEQLDFEWLPDFEAWGVSEWPIWSKLPIFIAVCLGFVGAEYFVLSFILGELGIQIPYLNDILLWVNIFNQ